MARPRKPVDENLLRKLAAIYCNEEEMAEVLGVSVDTLKRRFADQIKDARNERDKRMSSWDEIKAGVSDGQTA